MFKAIIFDVDGTLSETEEVHREAFNRSFELNGLPWHWDQTIYRELLLTTGGKERILKFIEQCAPSYLQGNDVDAFIRNLHASKTSIYTQLIAGGAAQLRPGIREVIGEARKYGIRLAIATTTSAPNVAALLESAYGSESSSIFEVICAGDSVVQKKPAADIYDLALRKLNLRAGSCIAVEDSRNGLLSSTRAGIATVVTPGVYTDDQNFEEAVLVTTRLDFPDLVAVYQETLNRIAC